ncbi:hypothetical protein OIO90_003294 [Microbotryomycetes sp. JL221]|nr:hypothetical protein OIO90_003294 [Microbotryomycetes sp. JL221]
MAPFPTRRAASSTSHQPPLLPTSTTPSLSIETSSVAGATSYPPPATPSSAQSSPRVSRQTSPDPFSSPSKANGLFVNGHHGSPSTSSGAGTLGKVTDPSSHGCLGGLGVTCESTTTLVELLQDNHTNRHTFFNDDGFHNHAAHHLLASYSLGASPSLLKEIYQLHTKTQSKPMVPLQPITITEQNWTDYLGDERLYPNFLAFFTRLIEARPMPPSPYAGRPNSVVPVVERYLFGGRGEMLTRAVSGAIHGLINVGYGVEFGLPSVVAEGLAQSAVTSPRVSALFPEIWPPPARQPSQFQSTLQSAFSSLRFGPSSFKKAAQASPLLTGSLPTASTSDSFAKTAARLPDRRSGETRIPRNGLSAFTILDRILNDPDMAPGRAGHLDDFPKLDGVLQRVGDKVVRWCEEWKFEGEGGRHEWDEDGEREEERRRERPVHMMTGSKVPSWREIVEKTEELFWVATVIFAASSRPGYVNTKLDFFLMHGLTSVLFLPPILEVISPHLRPYLLHSHFRVLVAYWISRGRPELHIHDTLMSATCAPRPPHYVARSRSAVGTHLNAVVTEQSAEESSADPLESPKTPQVDRNGRLLGPLNGQSDGRTGQDEMLENAWPRILASAADHPDDHLCKVVRSLAFAAMHFGHSPEGMFQSALPGTDVMDGTIFVRTAGIVMRTMGWCHEGESKGKWDRSCLGYDEAWQDEARDPNYVELGRSQTLTASQVKSKLANNNKGKGRSRSGTETEETFLGARAGSVTTSPVIAQGWYQSSTPERVASPVLSPSAASVSIARSPTSALSPASSTSSIASASSSPVASRQADTRLYVTNGHEHDEEADIVSVVNGYGYGRKPSEQEDEDEAEERQRRFDQDEEERELMA